MSITLVVLFIKPINKLILKQASKSYNESKIKVVTKKSKTTETETSKQETISDSNVAQSMVDADFLNVVIKHGILVATAILSSFVFYGLCIFTVSAFYNTKSYMAVCMFWITMDCVTTSFCTYVLRRDNERLYRILCNKLHSKCEKRKLKTIMNKMIQSETSK